MLNATLKSLLAHKLRLALTALAVVLGVAFISGTFVLTDTIKHVLKNGLTVDGKKVKKVFFKTNAYIDSDATHSCDNAEDLVRYIRHVRSRTPDKRINVLQEGLDGIALSTGRWWDGRNWVGPYLGTIERKKFMDNETGPATGCSLN